MTKRGEPHNDHEGQEEPLDSATEIRYSSLVGDQLMLETENMSFPSDPSDLDVDEANALLRGDSALSSERRQNQIEMASRASRRIARFA